MNETAVDASTVHGTNPQFLIEKITRLKVYSCIYWKEKCFGLTAETLLDRAITIKYYGGCYGGTLKPSPFLCLVLKLLQLQPEKEIIIEFIRNDDFKYLRALGAFYLRLVGKAEDVYRYLEPLYNDYRKLVFRGLGSGSSGWQVKHMDEFIDELLTKELVCDIALPFLQKRSKLEELGQLQPRKSILDEEIEFMQSQEEGNDDELVDNDNDDVESFLDKVTGKNSSNSDIVEIDLQIAASENLLVEIKKNSLNEIDNNKYDNGNKNDRRYEDDRRRDDKIDTDKTSGKGNETYYSRREEKSVSRKSRSRDRGERERDRDRRRSRSRDRDRERRRSRSRDRDRERKRSRSRDRERDRARRRSRSRDHDRERRRSRSRDRGECRRSRSRDRAKEKDRRSKSSESNDKYEKPNKAFIDFDDDKEIEDEKNNDLKLKEIEKANKKAAKKFDKIFGKKDTAIQSSSKAGQGKVEEGSVEYWNQIRASLGIKALRE